MKDIATNSKCTLSVADLERLNSTFHPIRQDNLAGKGKLSLFRLRQIVLKESGPST